MRPEVPRQTSSILIAVIAVFSALIALGTILSIPLPPPLYEITWSPPIYMALSVLAGPWPAFVATGLGSFIGESYNIATRGGPPIFVAGIVWARAPEALIIAWARKRGPKVIAAAMAVATVFETLAFFFPDWIFYAYGLFSYGTDNLGIASGFYAASIDFYTLVDLVYVPVALAIIRGAGPAFRRLGISG